ncbi:MAG: caspase family protein [Rhizobiaceae bacterium]
MNQLTLKRRLLGAAVIAATLGTGTGAALSERYAVLVGVTKYPALPPKNWLVGPANDTAMVRDFLEKNAQFKAENITVLADDVEGAKSSPNHDLIRAAMKEVAAKAGKDDFVYLHFGGHGFQQVALDPATETDGKDEIFLPADTKMPEGEFKRLPNAYIDDEVKADLDAIRAKGAFVWIVFDACHSSTATRAAIGGDEAERKIDWNDLGVKAPKIAEGDGSRSLEARESALGESPEGERGGLVAFYAAQTVETTPEMPLPLNQEGAKKYGLFSYTIMQQLAANPAMTYRQLGEAVLQSYSGLNRTRPTPLFEGDLDRTVFGAAGAERVLQWRVALEDGKATIPAGAIHRVLPGTRLAILKAPGDAIDAALGFVDVASAGNFEARLKAISGDGSQKAIKLEDIPKDAYARLADAQVDFTLTIARPDAKGPHPAEAAALNAALDAIAADATAPLQIALVESGASADLRIAVLSEKDIDDKASDNVPKAWLLPPSGEISLAQAQRPSSLGLTSQTTSASDGLAGPLKSTLVKIYRATNLARMASASDYQDGAVEVKFTLKRSGGGEEAITGGQVPIAKPDDIVHISAENKSGKPLDINVLYVGSDHSIGKMYAERLQSGAKLDEDILGFTAESFGIERMVVVLNEALPGTNVEDLGFLEQESTRQASRGAGGGDLGSMLEELAGGGATRAAKPLGQAKARRGAIMVVPIETVPAG